MVSGVASMGGLLFGYDQGNMSEILEMPPFLEYFDHPNATHQGFITSILTFGCFLGALWSASLADHLSRKYAIVVGCIVFIIGSSLQTGAVNEAMMVVSRIIGGIGVGILSNIVPLFQSEISPPEIRGRLICLQQIAITGGIMIAFWIGYVCSKLETTAAFRIPLGVQIIPALVLLITILFMPFSPRWLADKGRDVEALKVLAKIRANGDTNNPFVVQEFNEIKATVREEREKAARSYFELFKYPVRRRILIGIGLQVCIQLTGINTIMYYAPKIFKQAGLSGTNAPLLAQGLNGVLNFLCTFPTTIYIDRWGRRSTLLYGAVGMVIAYVVMGTVMALYGQPFQDGERYKHSLFTRTKLLLKLQWHLSISLLPLMLSAGAQFVGSTLRRSFLCVFVPKGLQSLLLPTGSLTLSLLRLLQFWWNKSLGVYISCLPFSMCVHSYTYFCSAQRLRT